MPIMNSIENRAVFMKKRNIPQYRLELILMADCDSTHSLEIVLCSLISSFIPAYAVVILTFPQHLKTKGSTKSCWPAQVIYCHAQRGIENVHVVLIQ